MAFSMRIHIPPTNFNVGPYPFCGTSFVMLLMNSSALSVIDSYVTSAFTSTRKSEVNVTSIRSTLPPFFSTTSRTVCPKAGLDCTHMGIHKTIQYIINSHSGYQDIIHSVNIGNIFRLSFILILLCLLLDKFAQLICSSASICQGPLAIKLSSVLRKYHQNASIASFGRIHQHRRSCKRSLLRSGCSLLLYDIDFCDIQDDDTDGDRRDHNPKYIYQAVSTFIIQMLHWSITLPVASELMATDIVDFHFSGMNTRGCLAEIFKSNSPFPVDETETVASVSKLLLPIDFFTASSLRYGFSSMHKLVPHRWLLISN